MDPSKTVDERTAALLAQMTLEEKQAQTIHLTGYDRPGGKQLKKDFGATGIGAVPGGFGTESAMAVQNELQMWFVNNSRLHIPITFHSETLHSSIGKGTIFPMPCLQGATWNQPLVHDIASAIAKEASSAGIDRGFSPELNVCTDPRFGRTEENFGEDPNLVAAMGEAAVKGLHNGEVGGPSSYLPKGAIVSEAKHAAAYGFGGKDGMAADMSERTLHDIYLKPWKRYAEAGGRAAMLAHNSINDVPCHSSAYLMGQLRSWGNFSNAFMASDMCDIGLLADLPGRQAGFGTAKDLQDAAAQSAAAGMDQELCNPTDHRGQAFTSLAAVVKSGALDVKHLDRAAANILRAKFAVGLFDKPVTTNATALEVLDCKEHRALARTTVHEGAILLRNDGTLPLHFHGEGNADATELKNSVGTIAIIGPLAGCWGNATADCEATHSQVGGYTNMGAEIITVLSAATNRTLAALPSSVTILSHMGLPSVGSNDTSKFPAMIATAKQADVVVVVVGDSGNEGWDQTSCGEDEDRTTFDPPGAQMDMMEALVEQSGKPVIAVLIHGRPVTFGGAKGNQLLQKLSAVLATWRPGEEGGPAVLDLLTGKVNPSGRLAQAWPRSAGFVHSQTSPWFSKRQGDFDHVDYARDGPNLPHHSQTPLFPFGFGMSFSSFNVTGNSARILPSAAGDVPVVEMLSTVHNTGTVAGKTVVAVYQSKSGSPRSKFVRYHKMLAAWVKTPVLAAGATQQVTVRFPLSVMSVYNTSSKQQEVELGEYTLTASQDSSARSNAHSVVLVVGPQVARYL
jgi:beta-glucosidase